MHCNPTLSNSDKKKKKKKSVLVIVDFTHIFRKKQKTKRCVQEYLSIHRCTEVLLPVKAHLKAGLICRGRYLYWLLEIKVGEDRFICSKIENSCVETIKACKVVAPQRC